MYIDNLNIYIYITLSLVMYSNNMYHDFVVVGVVVHTKAFILVRHAHAILFARI
jgi:hypothetical protein